MPRRFAPNFTNGDRRSLLHTRWENWLIEAVAWLLGTVSKGVTRHSLPALNISSGVSVDEEPPLVHCVLGKENMLNSELALFNLYPKN